MKYWVISMENDIDEQILRGRKIAKELGFNSIREAFDYFLEHED